MPGKDVPTVPTIHSKLPDVGTTIFTVMSSLAAELGAVNLGQGFPDYPMSAELISLVDEAMREGYNQYVHMNGLIALREALADKIQFLYGAAIDPESQITVTPGGTYAIYTALTAVLHTRRRGHCIRARLRQLYPERHRQWGRAGTHRPALPRLSHRLGRSAPADHRPHQDDHAQLTE